MQKVLVDVHRLGGNKYNGLYHFCYQLATYLAKTNPTDFDLHFYVPAKAKGLIGNSVNYTTQRSVDKFFRFGTGKFSVWHVATTLSWYRPFNSNTKNIFTIHDLNFLEEDYSVRSKKKYLRLIQQRVDRADYLTFISQFALKQAQEHLKLPNIPYSIIYNGCNVLSATNTNPIYRSNKPFLFSIGQFHARKNFHVLPALLVGNDYELIIAGLNDFVYKDRIIAEAKKHAVLDRVKLIGAITEDDKAWYYKNCLAFVFPSIGEGFGLPVLEAMQMGKPVFLSTYTSLPEVGGGAAYYFNDFDLHAMQKTFIEGLHHFTTNNTVQKIKDHAATFSWDKAAREYLSLYKSLLK
jgi:glycosyltransferase involved in cell wall biosynthesis